MSKLRCISWIAVSSKPQNERESPTEQRTANRRLIDDLGGELVAELDVPGESREYISLEDACAAIPAYAQLRDIAAAKSANLLICRDLSRLGRTQALILQLIAHCHRAGIAVYSRAAPPASLNAREQAMNEGATLMLALEASLSQTEMIRLRQRHTYGMIGRIKRGEFASNVPYGYRYDYDGAGNRKTAVDEQQAEAVRLICQLYLDGHGERSIADRMNDTAYAPAARDTWTRAGVRVILRRIWRYAGYGEINRRSKSRLYLRAKGKWEPIIDESMAGAVERERQRRMAVRRSVGTKRLFSQVCYCQQCGGRLGVSWSRQWLSYRCGNWCPRARIAHSKLLKALRTHIREMAQLADPTELVELQSDNRLQNQTELDQVDNQLSIIEQERMRLTRAWSRLGAISDEEYQILMADAERRRLAAETHKAELLDQVQRADSQEDRLGRLREWIDQGEQMLDSEDVTAANAWLRRHIRVYILDNQVFRVEVI